MENQKQISVAPMVLGIIGGVLGLPAAVCSGACAAGITAAADGSASASSTDTGMVFMWLGIVAAVLGFVSSFLYRKSPKLWGAIMILAAVISGITLLTFNILSLIVCILFLIGGVLAMVQPNPSKG